jgi:benzil reductase ((S)-benzoin forming)
MSANRIAAPRTAAVVTGHSRGLGEAIAEQLLDRGIPVLAVSRHSNTSLAGTYKERLREVRLDLADSAATLGWLRTSELRDFLRNAETACLVNNAGVLQPIGPLDVQQPDDVARAVSVNVGAVLSLSAAFVQAAPDVRDRRILHISSGAGSDAYAGWSVYCATKAALDHHARAVALDHTPRLRIASVAPGVIDTGMQAEIRESSDDRFPDRPRFIELKRTGKLRSPEQGGANVVDLLLSDDFGREPVLDLRYQPDRAAPQRERAR